MTTALKIEGLRAKLGDLEILKGVDLDVPFGEVHALMGPNGSGKSTLCHVLMGKAEYEAAGEAEIDGTQILGLPVDERARAGLFEAFQYPVEIPGVALRDLLDEMAAASSDQEAFQTRVERHTAGLDMTRFLDRSVNVALSGGEKKRSEMFQLAVTRPKVAVLDEIDSGLDIDAVREVAGLVESLRSPDLGVVIITHYSRVLRYLSADRIHIMMDGRIVRSGGPEIAEELESKGYDRLRQELGVAPATTDGGDPFADLDTP